MTVAQIWTNLNVGLVMTNGEISVTYVDGVLTMSDESSLIPFNVDNANEWYVYEEPSNEPLYYQYMNIATDESKVTMTTSFYKDGASGLNDSWVKYGTGYTLEELKDGCHD